MANKERIERFEDLITWQYIGKTKNLVLSPKYSELCLALSVFT